MMFNVCCSRLEGRSGILGTSNFANRRVFIKFSLIYEHRPAESGNSRLIDVSWSDLLTE